VTSDSPARAVLSATLATRAAEALGKPPGFP